MAEYAVTLNDNAIMIDMLSILMGRTSVVTIEMCFDVLPIAKDICLSQFEECVVSLPLFPPFSLPTSDAPPLLYQPRPYCSQVHRRSF
jgi:hypothetical protein